MHLPKVPAEELHMFSSDSKLLMHSGVVAGGQTGVDQAALAVAHEVGLATGHCHQSGTSYDGP